MKFLIRLNILILVIQLGWSEPLFARTEPFRGNSTLDQDQKKTQDFKLIGQVYVCKDSNGSRVFTDSTAQLVHCQSLRVETRAPLERRTIQDNSLTVSLNSSKKSEPPENVASDIDRIPDFTTPSDFPEGEAFPLEAGGGIDYADSLSDPLLISEEIPPSLLDQISPDSNDNNNQQPSEYQEESSEEFFPLPLEEHSKIPAYVVPDEPESDQKQVRDFNNLTPPGIPLE